MSQPPEVEQSAASSVWLKRLNPEDRTAVIAAGQLQELPAGARLFHQGDRPAGLLLLLSGRVRTWSRNSQGAAVALKMLHAGDLVGCLAAFSGHPQPAGAETASAAQLLFWPDEVLRALLHRFPALTDAALEIVGERAISLLYRLVTVSTAPAPARIAAALLDLSGGRAGRIPVSRQEIADLTATTMHTVSRVISAWHRRGWLIGGRSRIDLLDLAALTRETRQGSRGLKAA